MFPVSRPFAEHHAEFWRWLWAIEPGERPEPFVGIWPRGGGKSSSAEMGVVALAARRRRRYAVYISGTQDQADARVGAVATLLESSAVARHYPKVGQRAVRKYGSSKGWRRNRLWTATGFVCDALGLDTAIRGIKADDQRPDLIILDDIDDRHDTPAKTEKKIQTLTETVLPIGADDAGVLALQNLIIPHGVFSQLADGRASFLIDRRVSGPVPALRDLRTEPRQQENGTVRQVITGGEPTWPGQDVPRCQQLIDTLGPRSFLREQQHEVHYVEGALWKPEMIRHVAEIQAELSRVVVGVDPSGGGAEIGIVVAGLMKDGRTIVLQDATQPGRLGVGNWTRAVWGAHDLWGGDTVAAEKNFGGDMVAATLDSAALGPMRVLMVNASRGKAVRAEPVVQKYEGGWVLHLGAHPDLEAEMTQWVPGSPGWSPNRVDALVWAITELYWPSEAPLETRLTWGRG